VRLDDVGDGQGTGGEEEDVAGLRAWPYARRGVSRRSSGRQGLRAYLMEGAVMDHQLLPMDSQMMRVQGMDRQGTNCPLTARVHRSLKQNHVC
jgi:hypothetical protein